MTMKLHLVQALEWQVSCIIAIIIVIVIKCIINVIHFNHPKTMFPFPGLWKNCLFMKTVPVPERLGTSVVGNNRGAECGTRMLGPPGMKPCNTPSCCQWTAFLVVFWLPGVAV